jgi:hypothetical protein
LGIYYYAEATEHWLDNHITELSHVLLLTTILQALGLIFKVVLGIEPHEGAGLLSLIHIPYAEIGFGLIMLYLCVKLGREWKRARDMFRSDAWGSS